jgi:signal transduction histidine kinase
MLVLSASAVAVLMRATLWLVVPIAIGLIALYPGFRARLGTLAERLLFDEVRDQAAIAATEEERARLASEIHDGPLQELAAVITELDEQRELVAATSTLRGVASHLRDVSTALRPPVLDDLGLAAALGWLVDQARERAPQELALTCAIDDRTSVRRAARPPSKVELAVFRIAQEALNNALRHADASRISVSVTVALDAIDLAIADDGRGLDETATRAARRRGRLGLTSMRQRATSIGADMSIANGVGSGTAVVLHWDPTT